MGIDANILLRVKGNPTADELKAYSYRICDSIGASHFIINREKGLGAITKTLSFYRDKGDPKPGKAYHQDGDDIIAEGGETLLEVNLWTRYYGVGYERGDLLTICAVAEWCEANIPDCEVWYGGDSSGVCAEPFPDSVRQALRKHMYSQKGREYFQRGPWGAGIKPDLKDCKLCIPEGAISQYGTGLGYAAWSCAGCGQKFITQDGGATWSDKDDLAS